MRQLSALLVILFSICVLVSAVRASDSRVPAPTIVLKDQWGSMKEGDFYNDRPFDPYSQGPLGDPRAITIHHTAMPEGTHPPNREEDIKKVKFVQQFHVGKGWGDVGYHFLIGSEGTIYQGRPLPWMGTHAPPNSFNIGVNIIGDFHTKEYPSSVQLESAIRLMTWLCDTYDIDPLSKIDIFGRTNFGVVGHRDWGATACPGDRFYALMPSIRERIRAGLLADAPAYDSRVWAFQYLPETLLAGRKYELPLTVRNTGFTTWSWQNQVRLESTSPSTITVAQANLAEKEEIQPLGNKTWQVTINTPTASGLQRPSLRMAESDRQFGSELVWEPRVVPADGFVSQWLSAGPFPAKTPDFAYMNDYFAGQPIDTLDIMDQSSEAAHGYKVDGEYSGGDRNFRGEDGERMTENGRYYRGEESFNISVKGFKGNEVVLRRLTDGDNRDQDATVYLDGRRFRKWEFAGMAQYRLWKNMDLIIPSYLLAGKDSVNVRVKSNGTPQYGNCSFRYTVLDQAESLVAPKSGISYGGVSWREWKSDAGITDISTAYPNADQGALYMAVYVKSPVTKHVELRTGYNGWIKAWMNGAQAVSGRAEDQGFPDTMKGEVLLKKGWNRLLVKVALEPGMKDLYVRLCEKDGQPIKGLKYSLDPMESSGKQELIARN